MPCFPPLRHRTRPLRGRVVGRSTHESEEGDMFMSRPLPRFEPPTGITVGTYDTYEAAQRAVDYLSDNQFPVENVTIVGNDLRMVERVTGRLTQGRAAGAGAAAGAWWGLFIGAMLTLFAS